MDTNQWLSAAYAEEMNFPQSNTGFDILSADSAFSWGLNPYDFSTNDFDTANTKKYNSQNFGQWPNPPMYKPGVALPQPQSTTPVDSHFASMDLYSPLSATASDSSMMSGLLASPFPDATFNGAMDSTSQQNITPDRKCSIDTTASDWTWGPSDTSSLSGMSLSTPTSVDRDPSPPSMHKPEETFQFPYTDPSASRVIRIETDPCFSDSGYNPPVNHSSAAATERVMSLLGSLQPVISSARSNLTTWQSQQPVHDESFMQQAVFSKKRKFEDEADLSFGAESYQPNKRREYLDYFSFYDVPQTAQRYASVESTEAPSEISETQVTSTSLTYTKRRRRLTANERKRNRVLSEKQRREELKGRLDEICAMVPGLHSNLGTKSFVLQQVADWLQNLLGENRKLQSYLKELPPC